MANMNDLVVQIGADIGNLKRDMAKMERTVDRTARRMGNSFGKVFKAANLSTVGGSILALGKSLADAIARPVEDYAEFDRLIHQIGIKAGASAKGISSLRKAIRELGGSTPFAASEIAAGVESIASATKLSAEQIEGILPSVLRLSLATSTGMEMSASSMTSIMTQFGLGIEDSARVADLLAFAANNSALSVDKLREAMKNFGQVADSVGVSLEDSLVGAMLLSNLGTEASSVGTGMKKLITTLMADSRKLGRIFQTSFTGADGEFIGLSEAIALMDKRMTQLGWNTITKASRLKEAFGLEGLAAGAGIAKDPQAFVEMFEKMRDLRGYAKAAADEMNNTLWAKMKNIGSAWEDLMFTIVSAVEGPLVKAFTTIADLFRAMKPFTKPFTDAINIITEGIIKLWAAFDRGGVGGLWAEFKRQFMWLFDTVHKKLTEWADYFAKVLGKLIYNAIWDVNEDIGKGSRRGDVEGIMAGAERRLAEQRAAGTLKGGPVDWLKESPLFGDDFVPLPRVVKIGESFVGKFAQGMFQNIGPRAKAFGMVLLDKMNEAHVQQQNAAKGRGGLIPAGAGFAAIAPETHGVGGGGLFQLGSAETYRKIFDYFTGQKKNKADQERNRLLKDLVSNTQGLSDRANDSLVIGLPGELA